VTCTRAGESTFEYKAQQPEWFVQIETIIISMAYRVQEGSPGDLSLNSLLDLSRAMNVLVLL